MTNEQVLQWVKSHLGEIIRTAIDQAKIKAPTLLYTEDWLAAMVCRETGGKISKCLSQFPTPAGQQLAAIAPLMMGDFTQRKGEPEKQYHGFGFWQIDIGSFPDFVKSGNWKDPAKTCAKAISVLEGKRQYIQQHFPALSGDALARAITAAYNCGEGNVAKVLTAGLDIDSRTAEKNYSKEVWEFREIYNTL